MSQNDIIIVSQTSKRDKSNLNEQNLILSISSIFWKVTEGGIASKITLFCDTDYTPDSNSDYPTVHL